ncbi:MAG: class I SAM-dependent methyltransferase [Planctomycetaceae bacterium]
MDIREYNRDAWNTQVRNKNQWTVPVSAEEIAEAREGRFSIVLTPKKPVPMDWFGELKGADVLCLASGGGQQGPILAAAGANVTVFDNSPGQLAQDRAVAERESLDIKTVEGDMRDLSCFADESFDLIFHPCSNTFVPDIQPVWNEAARVLKTGGVLLAGFVNPILFVFDYDEMKKGNLKVRHKIPYSDLTDISEEERQQLIDEGEPLCFGHTLEDQIGGQAKAGLAITGFFEDKWLDDTEGAAISEYLPAFIGTRSQKL